jgi:hypothetical protein
MNLVSPQQSETAFNSALYDIVEGTGNLTLSQGNFTLKYIVWSICVPTAAKLDVI